jgi:hypothetical protein
MIIREFLWSQLYCLPSTQGDLKPCFTCRVFPWVHATGCIDAIPTTACQWVVLPISWLQLAQNFVVTNLNLYCDWPEQYCSNTLPPTPDCGARLAGHYGGVLNNQRQRCDCIACAAWHITQEVRLAILKGRGLRRQHAPVCELIPELIHRVARLQVL